MVTRRPSTIRTTITFLTSQKSHARTLDCSVFPQCLKPLFRTFLILFFREKAKKACFGKPLLDREREERQGSVISVAESMSKKSRRNNIRSHSLQTHREFYSDERDLREDLERRPQQAVLGENSAQRKWDLTKYDLEIQNLERRNSEYALIESRRELESQRRQLLETNQWADQAQRERILLCSELEMKNRLHRECYARSGQEIEELRRRCYKEENEVTQQTLNEYSMQQAQESRTASLVWDQIRKLQERLEFIEDSKIFQDPDSPSRCGSTRVSPSSFKKPSREIHEKTWVFPEAFLIVNLPNECLTNFIMIQDIWQHHRRFREEKELRKVGVKNHCNQYLYLAFWWKPRKKKSGRQKLS